MPVPAYTAELLENSLLAANTIGLTFRVDQPIPEQPAFSFTAGQFVSIAFTANGEDAKRSYSIASAPRLAEEKGTIEIAIGLVPNGKASQYFTAMKPGDQCTMTGPFGVLTLPAPSKDEPSRLVLAATGTGVAPYRSMLPELKECADQGTRIHLLMGARTRQDLFYQDDFQTLANSSENVIYETCLSREQATDASKGELTGYIQDRLKILSLMPGQDLVYLCGNPAMIDDNLKLLAELGFGPRQIKREKYTFSR